MGDRKRKWVFWSGLLGAWALLTGLGWAGLALLRPLFGTELTGVRDGLPALSLLLSTLIAARLLRRLGLSREGHRTETLTQGGTEPAAGLRERVAVAAVHPWALCLVGLLSGVGAMAGVIVSEWVAAVAFGIVSALCWRGCFTDARYTCVADQDGVTARSLLQATPRRVPWEQIGECQIQATRDALGRPVGTLCTLFDHAGRQLLRLDLGGVSADEREQFLAAVRARLGTSERAELMAAEAPAGLGTELQASEVPAGRGTEPEAGASPVPGEEPAQSISTRAASGNPEPRTQSPERNPRPRTIPTPHVAGFPPALV